MHTVVEAVEVEDVHVFVYPRIILEPSWLSDNQTGLVRCLVLQVILRGKSRGRREDHLR